MSKTNQNKSSLIFDDSKVIVIKKDLFFDRPLVQLIDLYVIFAKY